MKQQQSSLSLFTFPYSNSLKAYVFGNFEQQLAFDLITDDDIIDVLNDVNELFVETKEANQSINSLLPDRNHLKAEARNDKYKRGRLVYGRQERLVTYHTVKKRFLFLVILAILTAIVVMSLRTAGVIAGNYDLLVKIVSFYVPIISTTFFAVYA